MRKAIYIIYITAVVVIYSVVLYSCSNVGCTENHNSIPLAGFYSYETKEPLTLNSVEIGGVGAPGDSLLLAAGISAGQLYLPFRATNPLTRFYIRYNTSEGEQSVLPDTLTFDYESKPYFASEDCGAMYHYLITSFSYTRHRVDSVAVTDSLITNIDRQTIEIYFHTSTTENPSEDEE